MFEKNNFFSQKMFSLKQHFLAVILWNMYAY